MTDGQWNTGRGPVLASQDAQATMIDVAEVIGGHHFHSSSAMELDAIFEKLARTFPVAFTQ